MPISPHAPGDQRRIRREVTIGRVPHVPHGNGWRGMADQLLQSHQRNTRASSVDPERVSQIMDSAARYAC